MDFPCLRIDVDQRDVAEVAVRVPEPCDRPAHERVTPAHQDVDGFEREAGAEVRVYEKRRCGSGENPVLGRKVNEMLRNIRKSILVPKISPTMVSASFFISA